MQNVTNVVIAAAGLGSRLGMGMPKCMIEIDGETILSRLIETLRPHAPNIHLVVGYREEMVIDYCSRHHRDIVLVRNPDFHTTNTGHSYAHGARHMSGKVLYLDGDLLIDPASLSKFLAAASDKEVLIGVTDAKSENAVYALGEGKGESVRITGFSRTEKGPYEWANVMVAPHDFVAGAPGYVYERLAEHLPLQGHMLTLAEVDTASDLTAAKEFLRSQNRK